MVLLSNFYNFIVASQSCFVFTANFSFLFAAYNSTLHQDEGSLTSLAERPTTFCDETFPCSLSAVKCSNCIVSLFITIGRKVGENYPFISAGLGCNY